MATVKCTQFGALEALDARDELYKIISSHEAKTVWWRSGLPDTKMQDSHKDLLINGLRNTEIVLWRADLMNAAINRYEQLIDTPFVTAFLPTSPQFWFIDRKSYIDPNSEWAKFTKSHADPRRNLHCIGVLVVPAFKHDGIVKGVTYNLTYSIDDYVSNGDDISHYWSSYQQPIGTIGEETALLTSALIFLGLEFVGRQGIYLPRPDMRRYLHKTRNKHIPLINTVVLRRTDSQVKRDDRIKDIEGAHKGYTDTEYCWSVRGHWRKLTRPRKTDGAQVTYVHAYIKGDPEKPLKPPKENVYLVRR